MRLVPALMMAACLAVMPALAAHGQQMPLGVAERQAQSALPKTGGTGSPPAAAPDSSSPARQAPGWDFDLPRLPLSDALLRYTEITGRSVIYDTGKVSNRYSAAVRGHYDADTALNLLLADSGLAVRYATARAVSLVPAAESSAVGQSAIVRSSADPVSRQHYYAALQTRVLDLLCAHPDIDVGSYRLVLRLRIDAASTIKVLDVVADGHPRQETLIRDALAGQGMAQPPAGFGEPITALLTPESARREGGCGR